MRLLHFVGRRRSALLIRMTSASSICFLRFRRHRDEVLHCLRLGSTEADADRSRTESGETRSSVFQYSLSGWRIVAERSAQLPAQVLQWSRLPAHPSADDVWHPQSRWSCSETTATHPSTFRWLCVKCTVHQLWRLIVRDQTHAQTPVPSASWQPAKATWSCRIPKTAGEYDSCQIHSHVVLLSILFYYLPQQHCDFFFISGSNI